jgi:hypothetical protein
MRRGQLFGVASTKGLGATLDSTLECEVHGFKSGLGAAVERASQEWHEKTAEALAVRNPR